MKNLKWVGTFLFVVAAVIMSLNLDITKWAFVLFFMGHVIFIYVFRYDTPMLVQNTVFLFLDTVGIIRWFELF